MATVEEKAKAYDEAIRKAKDMLNYKEVRQEDMEYIFPELKESEDERIRKEIIRIVDIWTNSSPVVNGIPREILLDWVEKQGEHANFINKIQIGDKVTRNEDGVLVNLSQLNRVAKKYEKQCEQKPADETKFKVGDWVVYCNDDVDLITGIEENGYCINNGGYIPFVCESDIRLWTIEDAKDGDVLCTKNKCCPFIYDKGRYNNGLAYYYAGIDVSGNLNIKSPHNMLAHFGRLDNIRPATKERRDLLFAKMKEAGYEWDADKKELKKIEQKPTWSEDDENRINRLIAYFEDKESFTAEDDVVYANWLKSIKDRVQPQPKQEWSKEDEKMVGNIRRIVEQYAFSQSAVDVNGDLCKKEYIDADNWLKNLKDRCVSKSKQEVSSDISIVIEDLRELLSNAGQSPDWVFNLRRDIDILNSLKHLNRWKPSEGQLECLGYAIEKAEKDWSPLTNNRIYLTLKALKEQLEKL